MKDANLLNQRI